MLRVGERVQDFKNLTFHLIFCVRQWFSAVRFFMTPFSYFWATLLPLSALFTLALAAAVSLGGATAAGKPRVDVLQLVFFSVLYIISSIRRLVSRNRNKTKKQKTHQQKLLMAYLSLFIFAIICNSRHRPANWNSSDPNLRNSLSSSSSLSRDTHP